MFPLRLEWPSLAYGVSDEGKRSTSAAGHILGGAEAIGRYSIMCCSEVIGFLGVEGG